VEPRRSESCRVALWPGDPGGGAAACCSKAIACPDLDLRTPCGDAGFEDGEVRPDSGDEASSGLGVDLGGGPRQSHLDEGVQPDLSGSLHRRTWAYALLRPRVVERQQSRGAPRRCPGTPYWSSPPSAVASGSGRIRRTLGHSPTSMPKSRGRGDRRRLGSEFSAPSFFPPPGRIHGTRHRPVPIHWFGDHRPCSGRCRRTKSMNRRA
jgi:hypothetical protein